VEVPEPCTDLEKSNKPVESERVSAMELLIISTTSTAVKKTSVKPYCLD